LGFGGEEGALGEVGIGVDAGACCIVDWEESFFVLFEKNIERFIP
jgi:hypothetical protein